MSSLPKITKGKPIQRLHAWLTNERRKAYSSCQPHADIGLCAEKPLLRMHLPDFKQVEARLSDAPSGDAPPYSLSSKRAAWLLAEWLICLYSYYETDLPRYELQYVQRFGEYSVSEQQVLAACHLYEGLLSFVNLAPSESFSRGRKSLLDSIKSLIEERFWGRSKGQPLEL